MNHNLQLVMDLDAPGFPTRRKQITGQPWDHLCTSSAASGGLGTVEEQEVDHSKRIDVLKEPPCLQRSCEVHGFHFCYKRPDVQSGSGLHSEPCSLSIFWV